MGRTTANSVCFTKTWIKIAAFPNATPISKFLKNLSVGQKKNTVVYGWGRQIFPISPKENKNSLSMSTACLFEGIDLQIYLYGKARENQERTLRRSTRIVGLVKGFQTPFSVAVTNAWCRVSRVYQRK